MHFIGRKEELTALNDLYHQNRFQLFILYGRRRVGKTTFLNEFCRDKKVIFYSAEQSNDKLNLEKFSERIFSCYGEEHLEPFTSWTNALSYIDERQKDEQMILVFDEFPYLAMKNRSLLSELQHLIDHKLQFGKLFVILCGSYMGFMEKEVLGSKSPLFGRRTGQLHMKPFHYSTGLQFMPNFSNEEKMTLYGAFGGTPLYLGQIQPSSSLEDNIKRNFLQTTSYLYEEPLLLLRQEVQEPGVYSAIIEAIAGGASKANEISTKIGEGSAKCLKYIKTLCELGIIYKETPFGEKDSSRRTIYGIADFMFRFWYRYVFPNRTLIETGASEAVWKRRIEPDLNRYMGLVFEKVCRDYLLIKNSNAELPFLFTSIGRWWGTDNRSSEHKQVEIDIVAGDKKDFLICECKWTNEKTDRPVVEGLKRKADVFCKDRARTWYVLFSKNGFTPAVVDMSKQDERLVLIRLSDLMETVSAS